VRLLFSDVPGFDVTVAAIRQQGHINGQAVARMHVWHNSCFGPRIPLS